MQYPSGMVHSTRLTLFIQTFTVLFVGMASVVPPPVDHNEPVYCYCQRVSFGEMIACDNEDCAIEWFHFECVGLTTENRPKGKWYCRECTQLRKAGK